MFENSQDILNIAKTVASLGLSFTLGFLFWYLGLGARELYRITREMRERTHKIDELIELVKEKFTKSTSNIILITKGVEQIVKVAKSFSKKSDKKVKK